MAYNINLNMLERFVVNRCVSYLIAIFGIIMFSGITYILQGCFFGILILDNELIEVMVNIMFGLVIPYLISKSFKRYGTKLLFGR